MIKFKYNTGETVFFSGNKTSIVNRKVADGIENKRFKPGTIIYLLENTNRWINEHYILKL